MQNNLNINSSSFWRVKILLIMRLVLYLVLIGLLPLHASVYSQNASMNIQVENLPMRDALREIERESGMRFFMSDDLAAMDERISLSMENQSFDQVMSHVLSEHGLSYRIFENKLVVITETTVLKQSTTISGTVNDDAGIPIPGVNVTVKGTLVGVVTDIDGKYSINVPNNDAVLIFSFVGYVTQEIPVGNQRNINVSFVESTLQIDEVVVVGYGTQRRGVQSTAVSTVKGDNLKQLPTLRTDAALQGRAAGVMVQNTDGAPGGNVTIRIRGANSVSGGNNALIVIDGMQSGDLTTLNPNDIQSIDILKDAAATAIYGARGANGVILVTTKRGASAKPVFFYNYSVGIQNLNRKLDLLNAGEYAENQNYLNQFADGTVDNPVTPIIPFTEADIAKIKRDGGTDWQDEIFRTGIIQSHMASMTGGSENIKYFVSGGYLDQEGILINTKYERYNIRTNLDMKMTSWLDAGISMNFMKSKGNVPPVGEGSRYGDVLGQVINTVGRFDPITPVYNDQGDYNFRAIAAPTTGRNYADMDVWNPVATALETKAEKNVVTQDINGFFDIKIIDGLTLRISAAAALTNTDNMIYRGQKTLLGSSNGGNGTLTSEKSFYFQNSNILTYDKKFGDHMITFTGVAEQQMTRWTELSNIEAQGFASDISNISDLGSASLVTSRSNNETKRALNSYLGRINYAYKERYLFSASIRADGSSVFGANNKWGYFPSVSAGWKISEEDFIKNNLSWVSNLKIRGSYGVTGNQGISPYNSLAIVSSGYDYPYTGGSKNVGYRITSPPNPSLKWETTKQFDFGIDVGLYNQRVTLSVDMYDKETNDLLLSTNLERYTGFASMTSNVGSIGNKGFELSIEATPVITRDWQWSSGFNFSINRGKILALATDFPLRIATGPGGGYGFHSGNWALKQLKVGESVEQMYGYVNLGMWGENEAEQAKEYGAMPGSHEKWLDVNGDKKINIDGDGNEKIGNAEPKFYYGWNNTVNYKNFGLSFMIQGSYGNDIFNAVRVRNERGGHGGMDRRAINYWSPTNTNTFTPMRRSGIETSAFNKLYPSTVSMGSDTRQTRWVEDGTYIRLKNITLSYNLPTSVTKALHIDRLSVYISGTNLITITDYTGYDPEVSSFNVTTAGGGIDLSNYPTAKTVTFGVNLTF